MAKRSWGTIQSSYLDVKGLVGPQGQRVGCVHHLLHVGKVINGLDPTIGRMDCLKVDVACLLHLAVATGPEGET